MNHSVGFTGTRNGMTPAQRREIAQAAGYLSDNGYTTFHHGDCIGADSQAHDIFLAAGFVVVVHPPVNPKNRAYRQGTFMEPEREYMVRNEVIVDSSDIMLATPKEMREVLRSGTWSAIRYTRKMKKSLFIVYPSGSYGA